MVQQLHRNPQTTYLCFHLAETMVKFTHRIISVIIRHQTIDNNRTNRQNGGRVRNY